MGYLFQSSQTFLTFNIYIDITIYELMKFAAVFCRINEVVAALIFISENHTLINIFIMSWLYLSVKYMDWPDLFPFLQIEVVF